MDGMMSGTMDVEVVPAGSYVVSDMDVDVGYIGGGYIDGGYIDGGYVDGGYMGSDSKGDGYTGAGTAQAPLADRLLGSAVFIGGTGALALVFGIVCGLLLAKGKIKKGIDLYED